MLYNNEQIQEISTEEYFYLTENFELVDSVTTESYVRCLVYNKRKKLIDTVKQVMKNELTEKERNIALDYWCNNMSFADISKKYHLSRSGFYRMINSVKKKLDMSLKYVLFYNDAVKPPSTQEFLAQLKTNFFMGEQIEN